MSGSRPLTNKQKRFVEEYLIDLNATAAAIRAGYSEKSAGQIGEQNLKKLEIQNAIDEAMQKRSEKTNITAERVLAELAKVAFGDIRTLFDDAGNLKPMSEMPDESVAMIASFDTSVIKSDSDEPEIIKKIKLSDKLRALEMLGKHLKLFTDKVDMTSNGQTIQSGVMLVPETQSIDDWTNSFPKPD